MTNLTLGLQVFHVIPQTAVEGILQILFFIYAVQHSDIGIICAEKIQFPLERPLDIVQILRPSVFAVIVDCAEVHLGHDLFSAPLKGSGIGREGRFFRRRQVKEIDTGFDGCIHGFRNLLLGS